MRTSEEIAELIAMDINSGRALRYAPAKIIESVLRELKPALLEAHKEGYNQGVEDAAKRKVKFPRFCNTPLETEEFEQWLAEDNQAILNLRKP